MLNLWVLLHWLRFTSLTMLIFTFKQVEDTFVQIDPEPLGAASLAQVHKATLKDGTVVAVKIQHPKVKRHSFVDIKTMEVCFTIKIFTYNLVIFL